MGGMFFEPRLRWGEIQSFWMIFRLVKKKLSTFATEIGENRWGWHFLMVIFLFKKNSLSLHRLIKK
jgi:hypothetical protein